VNRGIDNGGVRDTGHHFMRADAIKLLILGKQPVICQIIKSKRCYDVAPRGNVGQNAPIRNAVSGWNEPACVR
jgi:hypothetical protein